MSGNLDLEAQAFDNQIDERMANGHVPDLRRVVPCNYFYNNSWRHPDFVRLDMLEQFERIRSALECHLKKLPSETRILEIGCGPGYLSLELARAGYNVTGMDLSERCIEIAGSMAADDPFIDDRGSLRYIAGDIFDCPALESGAFDAVIFLGALHHFAEQNKVLQRAKDLLSGNGILVAHEPTRDRMSKRNVTISYLIRGLMSAAGGYYTGKSVPDTEAGIEEELKSLSRALVYENEAGDKIQSVNDNDAGHGEMYRALGEVFEEVEYEERYAVFHEIIGGLRFDIETNAVLARFIRDMDKLMVKGNMLDSTEFLFVGKKN